MRRAFVALLLAVAPALLGEDPPAEPQAVKALEQLRPRADAGPFSWTAGQYQYDGAGNITAIGNETFVYDKLGRLKSATVRGPDSVSLQTQTFTYDDYGNLTSTSKLGQTVLLSVDLATNRLSGIGYDVSGNVIDSGMQHYDYDAAGMLNTVRGDANSQPRIVYAYTADDERLFSFDVSTGATHWTLRGFDNKVLRDFRQQGNIWSVDRDYVYRDGLLLAALKSGGAVEHYTLDHLGTPRLITDGSGHKVGYHAYWPFGEEWSPGNAQEGSPLQFTGHERDADGVDYMHARYYRAGWGRFQAADPVLGKAETPQSWNRYSYALNNPVLHNDPAGRCIWDGCVLETVGVFAVATTVVLRYEIFLRSPNAQDPSRTNRQVAADNIRRWLSLSEGPNKTVDDVMKNTRPGPKTAGPSTIVNKAGGYTEALDDFNDVIVPGSAVDKGNGVIVGTLPDGKTIVVRPKSSDGSPTLEVQDGRKKTKIRYREQDPPKEEEADKGTDEHHDQ